ncbi:unnamed protein product, partial [Prorocentrum cordatum]
AQKFDKLWQASKTPELPEQVGCIQPLDVVPPPEMRAVSHRYKLTSATSVDGFHMRHFSSIADQGLLALMSLYAVMEATSILPNQ